MDDGRALILKAFAMAKNAGKADWQRMTSAVLKNRILLLSGDQFKESEHGATTFRDFLDQFQDLVRIDATQRPPVVELIGDLPQEASIEPAVSSKSRWRIRPDLWTAVLDYRSGQKYVWDIQTAKARRLAAGEKDPTVLPTVSPDELHEWRWTFVSAHRDKLDSASRVQLERWFAQRLWTQALPERLRTSWNDTVKLHVAERLEAWFPTVGIPLPSDLKEFVRPRQSTRGLDIRALRSMIIECVSVMTPDELIEVRLPATAVLRTHGREKETDES